VGLLTCVTGVSGSGKSTLVNDTLYAAVARELYRAHEEPAAHDAIEGIEHFDKVINVDQSPIGRTPRSNPATYTGLFTPIRELMAEMNTAKERGYGPGASRFNVAGGRCEACQGDGVVKVEMHFLPDVYVPCDVCQGQRYNRETLEVQWKGRNIAQILDLTVEDAHEFLKPVPAIARKLQTLLDVGLSYIKLGQAATTLSGGEAQRVKLALELSKRDTGRTLYILDEPTTGLHFADIDLLLKVLHQLRDAGNTIVVIEHNLDVIKTADWVIDMGPEGGAGGGTVVVAGHAGRHVAAALTRPATPAGWRFIFAGLVLLVFALVSRKPVFQLDRRTFGQVTLVGLTQTSVQYVFFYIGLAYATGVKSSIMNATGTFFSVLLAHYIYKNDRLSFNKVLGCVVGFAGVMVVNFSESLLSFDFTLLGEGFVVIAAFVLSAASIYGKKVSQRVDSVVLTGWQLAIGGLALLLIGFATGGTLAGFTVKSTLLMVYLVVLSSAAFSLWTILLKYNRVSMITVFNFMVPIFGTMLSAVFLEEQFLEWKNGLALVLVCYGIWLVTKEEKTVD
jgi:drug/metabolite transporter (DMT)-like permease